MEYDKQIIKEHIRHIKEAVWSMESSSQHPKNSAHYRGILNSANGILRKIEK